MGHMEKIVVYLDNCCFNRPYDDQGNILIYLETEAKLRIQKLILEAKIECLWSFMLHYENNANPYDERRAAIGKWEHIAKESIVLSERIKRCAENLTRMRIKTKDAYHLACAIEGRASFFITTDKKLLNKEIPGIIVFSPIRFLERYYHEN
jgi:predicted nucleic acid-binding protein